MFRPYMWVIFRLRSNFSVAAIQDVWGVFLGYWRLGGGGKGSEISFVSTVGTMTWGYYKWIIVSFLCTRVKVGFYSYAKDILLLVTLVII